MRTGSAILLVTIFLLISMVAPSSRHAEDGDACAHALLIFTVVEIRAIDAIRNVESARQRMESKKEELAYCLRFPDIYSISKDNCDTLRWSYESLKTDYRAAFSELSIIFNELTAIIGAVQSCCDNHLSAS